MPCSGHDTRSGVILGVLVSMRRFSRCRGATGSSLAIAASLIVVIMVAGQASAETPSPIPEPTTPAPSDPATANTSATPSAESTTRIAAEAAGSLSLSIESTGGPVSGHFFQDIGSYAFTGDDTDLNDGTTIEIYRRTAASSWTLQATTQLSGESYSRPCRYASEAPSYSPPRLVVRRAARMRSAATR